MITINSMEDMADYYDSAIKGYYFPEDVTFRCNVAIPGAINARNIVAANLTAGNIVGYTITAKNVVCSALLSFSRIQCDSLSMMADEKKET